LTGFTGFTGLEGSFLTGFTGFTGLEGSFLDRIYRINRIGGFIFRQDLQDLQDRGFILDRIHFALAGIS